MCGIFFSSNLNKQNDFANRVASALDLMDHRGPDGRGRWENADSTIYLGHLRLSINDLSEKGNQPMISPCGRYIMVCNGEIYNYIALKQKLEKSGYIFTSTSDSEVILHGFVEWGQELVNMLQGMFAFIVWDNKQNSLFAARDHVGMKPLYFREYNQDLIIASEVTGILPFVDTQTINRTALSYVLSSGYVPQELSIWEGIQGLKPGHFMTWDRGQGKVEIQPFWAPPLPEKNGTTEILDTMQLEFESLFEKIVGEHLISDVPIALFLSGGLDSTAVAVALSKTGAAKNIKAITVNYVDAPREEVSYAAQIAKALGLQHQIIDIKHQGIKELAQKAAAAYDQPQGYSALMSLMQISEIASKEYKVALTGDGGDEVFAGYNWYKKPPHALNGSLFSSVYALIGLLPSSFLRFKIPSKLSYMIYERISVLHGHLMRLFPRFLPHEINGMIDGAQFTAHNAVAYHKQYGSSFLPYVRRMQAVDLMTFCAGHALTKTDRASMHYGLELRAPFLDRRLIEWAYKKPIEMQKHISQKQLLKNYINKHLPAEITALPKQGFSVPLDGSLAEADMVDYINDSQLVRDDIISSNWQKSIGAHYGFAKLWTLYFTALWYNQHK